MDTEKRKKKAFSLNPFVMMRRMYEWVLTWAKNKYAAPALFVLAFAESSFFPVPPDVLQLALSVSKPKKAYWFAMIAAIGSVIGGIFGYLIGLFVYDTVGVMIIEVLHYTEQFATVGDWYNNNAFTSILISAFTPIPYKVFTIAAGVFRVSLWTLIIASAIGRSARFFLMATLVYVFGPRIKEFIDKYFNMLTIVFGVLLIGGFIIVKVLM